jgi:hypothetical protein
MKRSPVPPAASLALALSALALGDAALADDNFYRPSAGNLYIATTERYLYVIWAVPRDLSPFARIRRPDELEAYVARTALFLCTEHRARATGATRDCRVQLVQMNSNDEYTRSAGGGFRTIGRMLLPFTAATPEAHRRAQTLAMPALRPMFSQFELRPGAIPIPIPVAVPR